VRVLLLLVFLVLAVAVIAAIAYRALVASARAKHRRLEELRRKPTADELYRAGKIDIFEYERLLERELERQEKRKR
jgi:hypothetical protein